MVSDLASCGAVGFLFMIGISKKIGMKMQPILRSKFQADPTVTLDRAVSISGCLVLFLAI